MTDEGIGAGENGNLPGNGRPKDTLAIEPAVSCSETEQLPRRQKHMYWPSLALATAAHPVIRKEHRLLGLVLLLGLIQGLIYVFLVPPWQHYDEPGHFEYAWLVANREPLPEAGAYDPTMRRELAASMVENGFFHSMGYHPDLVSQTEPTWIGVPQTGDQPVYYWLAALPLRLARWSDVTFQMYLARMISLGLFLVTLAAGVGMSVELFKQGNPLRWMVPVMIALLPAFADLMTAVNNDVGAVAAFSLFLWAGVRLLRRGFNWPLGVAFLGTAVLCYFTKSTAAVALALAPLALLFSVPGCISRVAAWAFVLVAGLTAAIGTLGWGDAALWVRQGEPAATTRTELAAPLGDHAFRLAAVPDKFPPRLSQDLAQETVASLRGKTITVGAWMWSSQWVTARTPTLIKNGRPFYMEVQVGPEPQFFAFQEFIGRSVPSLKLELTPFSRPVDAAVEVFYDGVVLTEGERPPDRPPLFAVPGAERGEWDGTFTNALRNPSAEVGWPFLRPWAEAALEEIFPASPYLVLSSVLDWEPAKWYYWATLKNLVNTFWAQFGWTHVPLALVRVKGIHPYRYLAGVTVAGLLGLALAAWRGRRTISWELILFLGASVGLVWLPAVLRGIHSLTGEVFIPSARYAYPAIIPTAAALTVGWMEWGRLAERLPLLRARLPAWWKEAIFVAFFVSLDLLSFASIWVFYRS